MIDIPPMVPRAIQGMCHRCRSAVRSAFGLGSWFDVKTGVRAARQCYFPSYLQKSLDVWNKILTEIEVKR